MLPKAAGLFLLKLSEVSSQIHLTFSSILGDKLLTQKPINLTENR